MEIFKQSCKLEITSNGRTYQFHFAPDSPIGEIHDVLFQMKSFIVQKINEASPPAAAPQTPPVTDEVKSE